MNDPQNGPGQGAPGGSGPQAPRPAPAGFSPNGRLRHLKAKPLALADRLFAGFGPGPLAELEAMADDTAFIRVERSCAAWALARWRAMEGDPAGVLRALAVMRQTAPVEALMVEPTILEIDALVETGTTDAALSAALAAADRLKDVTEIEIMAANAFAAAGDFKSQLAWLNRSLIRGGLAPLMATGAAPSFAGLTSSPLAAAPGAGLLSVLMPARNASATIRAAISSVLGQSYRDLELLVVDDASDDDTWTIAAGLAAIDGRVRAFRQERQRGAYAARNRALAEATGDFVTCHDADDWSHPEKFARQIAALTADDDLCNASAGVPVTPSLRGLRVAWRRLLTRSFPSMLIRREQLLEVGGWDEVAVAADLEMMERLAARFGGAVADVLPNAPLSLLSTTPQSLTRQPVTGLGSLRYGARREYGEASRHWHRVEAARPAPDLGMPRPVRPFPVPRAMVAGSPAEARVDVVVVADYGGPLASASAALWAEVAGSGRSFAWLHLPRPEAVGEPVADVVRDRAMELNATPVVAGETVSAGLVIAADPLCLTHSHPGLAGIRGGDGAIVADVASDVPAAAAGNFRTMFGVAPAIVGRAELIARLGKASGPS